MVQTVDFQRNDTAHICRTVMQNVFEEIVAMKKENIECQNCRGLGIIGTSVGSNNFRGRDYDCDVCHGTGYIELFSGNSEVSQKHFAQQLKAEISALLSKYEVPKGVEVTPPSLAYLLSELQKLSAV